MPQNIIIYISTEVLNSLSMVLQQMWFGYIETFSDLVKILVDVTSAMVQAATIFRLDWLGFQTLLVMG